MLDCVSLIANRLNLIQATEPGARKIEINHLLDDYNYLHDETIVDGEFRNAIFREGLIHYVFFAAIKGQTPIGVEFPDMFEGKMPLWLLANFGGTVRHSSCPFSISVTNTKF